MSIPEDQQERIERFAEALDLLILRTLLLEPVHGHATAKGIEFHSEDVLQVEQGSLYTLLHRLIKRRWISAEEGTSETNRRAKFYKLALEGLGNGPWRLASGTSRHMRSHGFCGRRNRRANHEAAQAQLLEALDQEIRDHIARRPSTTSSRACRPRRRATQLCASSAT